MMKLAFLIVLSGMVCTNVSGQFDECPFDGEYFGNSVFTPAGRKAFNSCPDPEGTCEPAFCPKSDIVVYQGNVGDPLGINCASVDPTDPEYYLCLPDTCLVTFCDSPVIPMVFCKTLPRKRWQKFTRFECAVYFNTNPFEEPETDVAVIKGKKGPNSIHWRMIGIENDIIPDIEGKVLGYVAARPKVSVEFEDCPFDGEYFGNAVFTPAGREAFGSCPDPDGTCEPAICTNQDVTVSQGDIGDPLGIDCANTPPDADEYYLCQPDTCLVNFCDSPPIPMVFCKTLPNRNKWSKVTRFECGVYLNNPLEFPETLVAKIKGKTGPRFTSWKMVGLENDIMPQIEGQLLGKVAARNK